MMAMWEVFYQNILCIWEGISQLSAQISPAAFLEQNWTDRECLLHISAFVLFGCSICHSAPGTQKPNSLYFWATAWLQLTKHFKAENLPQFQFWCDASNVFTFTLSNLLGFFCLFQALPYIFLSLRQFLPILPQIHPSLE